MTQELPLGARVRVTRRLTADAVAHAKAAAINAVNAQAESAALALERLEVLVRMTWRVINLDLRTTGNRQAQRAARARHRET